MLKQILLAGLMFISLNAMCQINNGDEIVAEGNSKLKIKPDIALFTITVEKNDTIEKNVINELNIEINALQKTLTNLGFTNKNVKISDFKISSSQDNNEKKKYFALNTLKVDFELDNKIIDAFYKEIQNKNHKDLDIEFETQLSGELEKTTRIKLVQLAIEDAKNNAENISKTLNIKLGKVKQVSKYNDRVFNYNLKVDQVKFLKPRTANEIVNNSSFDKFDVVEIELEEKITIVYEINK
jgi:uncharacterized protein YggE